MRVWFKRSGRSSSLGNELTAARPRPSERLVHSILASLRPQQAGTRRARLRLGYAGALTAALVGVLAATGGFAYAASAVQQAAHAVHITNNKPRVVAAAAVSSACSQYAVAPVITGMAPTAGKVGTTVTITGSHFSGNSAGTSVTFAGGVAATFDISSDTTIRTTVPAGAKTGPITLTNCKGSASTGTFKVIPPKKKHHKPHYCMVPNVRGDRFGNARKTIARHHCGVGKVKRITAGRKHKNRVIAQSPHPGKHLRQGGKVNL